MSTFQILPIKRRIEQYLIAVLMGNNSSDILDLLISTRALLMHASNAWAQVKFTRYTSSSRIAFATDDLVFDSVIRITDKTGM
jgi:hypothetical protein